MFVETKQWTQYEHNEVVGDAFHWQQQHERPHSGHPCGILWVQDSCSCWLCITNDDVYVKK